MNKILIRDFLKERYMKLKELYDSLSKEEKEKYYINIFDEETRNSFTNDEKHIFHSKPLYIPGWQISIYLEANRDESWRFYIGCELSVDLQDLESAKSVIHSDVFKEMVFAIYYIKETFPLTQN